MKLLSFALGFLLSFFAVGSIYASDKSPGKFEQLMSDRKPWKGDLDGMVERRYIRVLTVHNPMMFFMDGAQQRGTTYELVKRFEEELNKDFKNQNKHLKMHVVFIVVPRDQLIPKLLEGRGDIASANLTITKERQAKVDFSDPFIADVKEVILTGPKSPKIKTLEDLSGKEIYVRRSSSYFRSITKLNEKFKKQNKAPIKTRFADENLEDADIVEMLNAGLVSMMVMDSHKARFWGGVFKNVKVRADLALRTGGSIAWAFRKNSPKLKARVNAFVKTHKKGTLMGNILLQRYLKENKWVLNSTGKGEREKFESMVGVFEKYADKYKFDHLQMAAQGYQESRLDQSVRSKAGAIGVMQMLPSTARDKNVNIPNIEKLEPNIHAGIKYMAFLRDRYFNDKEIQPLDKTLFTFAAYNAGPARVVKLREEAKQTGLDPNIWFDNVEVIAAKRIGRETVQYVSNIFKYYIAYVLITEDMERKEKAKKAIK